MVFLGEHLRNLVCVWFLDKQTLCRKELKNYLREGGRGGRGGRGRREGGREGGMEGGREGGRRER